MSLLDGGLKSIFGAAFGAVYLDATLAKGTAVAAGTGGFSVSDTAYPVKALVSSLSDRARAVSGVPDPAVTIRLLRAGMTVGVDLDDRITVSGLTYRTIRVEADPAGAAWDIVAVPVLPP